MTSPARDTALGKSLRRADRRRSRYPRDRARRPRPCNAGVRYPRPRHMMLFDAGGVGCRSWCFQHRSAID